MEEGGKQYKVHRSDLLYPELSFQINGVLFDVFKQIDGGHQEKYYQKAVAMGLKKSGIIFVEQRYVPLLYEGERIGSYYLDFFIEEKIVLELKRGQYIPAHIIQQTNQYLHTLDSQLGLIGCFTHTGVVIKRIINQN